MGSAQGVDAEREDYVVSVVEFAGDTASAQAALQRLFGLTEANASAVLREVPVAVRRGVNRIRAEYFRRALELAGLRVEVRDGDGTVVQPQAAGAVTQPQAARPPQPQAAAAPIQAPAGPLHATDRAPPRPVSAPLTAAGPAARESQRATPFGATLVMGGSPAPEGLVLPAAPANDVPKPVPKWGELQRPSVPRASQADLEADLARSLESPPWESEAVQLDAAPAAAAPSAGGASPWSAQTRAAQAPNVGPRELDADPSREIARQPWAGAAAAASADPSGPRELEADAAAGPRLSLDPNPRAATAAHEPPERTSSAEQSLPGLELAVDVRRRESSPRYEAIPAGERWRAPSAQIVARAQRKNEFHEMQSGMGDLRPSPRPPGMPAPAPAAAPRRPAPAAPAPATKRSADLGFWEVAGLALSGSAVRWIVAIAGVGIALGPIAVLCQRLPWVGVPLLLAGLCMQLGMCVEYQRSAFWAAAAGDERLDATPKLGLSHLIRTGIHPLGLALATDVLLWVWIGSQWAGAQSAIAMASAPALWALGFGPGVFWSIALANAAAHNDVRSLWNVPQSLRSLSRAPLALLQAAVAAGLAFGLILLVASAVLSALRLHGALAIVLASGLAAALSHGLMGAWMGRALRARPELFE